MSATQISALSQEWNTLQNNHEQYEKSALLIKLTGIALCVIGLSFALNEAMASAILLILWVQEGIFRTSQLRLGKRILRVERLLELGTQAEGAACQLHSEWLAGRPGMAGLVREYAGSTLKPTVAFPYASLLLINLLVFLFY